MKKRLATVSYTHLGLQKDAVVLNGDGLIGKIYEVGPGWSKVISVIDENNHVSFRANRDLNLLGILSGDGKGGLTGYMLDPEASIIEGDVLITSGIDVYKRQRIACPAICVNCYPFK